MTVRRLLVLCLLLAVLVAGVTFAGDDDPTRSETATALAGVDAATQRQPPVRLFAAWLDAFNSGDPDRYEMFLKRKFPFRGPAFGDDLELRGLTGGFDLRKLKRVSAIQATGLVQERDSGQFAEFELTLELDLRYVTSGRPPAIMPYRIAGLELRAVPPPAGFTVPRVTEEEAIAAVEALVQKRVAEDRFSGALLVAKDGNVLFSEAYGLADRKRRIPNTLQTRFRVGSMNKMFTAVAILQLVEAGKVELEAPIGRYLRDYPNEEVARRVTVHHLLTHTGGTGDIFGPEFAAQRNQLRTLADYVEPYGERGLEFEPGSRWSYSNYGFILLGVVIERVTGQSYFDYVKVNVYEPAGMTRSGSLPELRAVPDRSVGYTRLPPWPSGWLSNRDTLPYRGTSAGGGYSTVEDLERFADALLGNKLLSPDSTELLITGKVESFPGSRYGYGFEDARDAEGNGFVGHGGGAPGMNGDLRIFPKSGYVIAVLANMDPPTANQIAEYLDQRLPTDG